MNWITTVLVDLREQYVWLVVCYLIKEEWSTAGVDSGLQCALEHGTLQKLLLYVAV